MSSADLPRRPFGEHSVGEVFGVALRLGLTSFGGPIAHLGYFERTYVQRLGWLTAQDYAGLVALCQMLPGPASSQVGFLIGLRRAGWAGGLAAWFGFTLPSALALFAFALAAPALHGAAAQAVLHGLKLVAVCVVAQAVWSMARKLCPDRARAGLALAAATLLLLIGGPFAQVAALVVGAVGGLILCRGVSGGAAVDVGVGPRAGGLALVAFAGLMALAVAAQGQGGLAGAAATFYRAGALVFGGGHVVLPLLRDALVPSGWMSDEAFLAGYGAAQAVPGPLFAFAAYLGAAVAPGGPPLAAAWAAAATAAIFLPGLLLASAGARLWSWMGAHSLAGAALAGVNAAVVGVLGAALYDPIWTSAIGGARDVAVAAAGLVFLERFRAPPLVVVAFCVAASLAFALAG